VVLAGDHVRLHLNIGGLRQAIGLAVKDATAAEHVIERPISRVRRHGAQRLVIENDRGSSASDRDTALINGLVRGHVWWRQLLDGRARDISAIARAEGVSRSHVSRGIRLAFLAPDITAAILEGRQPPDLTLKRVLNGGPITASWAEQRSALGFENPKA